MHLSCWISLGPRINAGGRVENLTDGANLLLNNNPKEIFKIASELDKFNKERQLLEKDVLDKISIVLLMLLMILF